MTDSASAFEQLGLWDPDGPGEEDRLATLRYLVSLGAEVDDLVQHRDGLPALAAILALRGGRGETVAEASARSGLSEERLLRVVRAAGLAAPDADDHTLAPGFAGLARAVTDDGLRLGQDTALQILRVMGGAMAELADVMASALLEKVEPGGAEPTELDWAHAHAEAAALLPVAAASLDVLLRQHLVASQRSTRGAEPPSSASLGSVCVGLVELADGGLGRRISTAEMGGVVTDFEEVVGSAVVGAGGQVVKRVANALLFTADEGQAGCRAAVAAVTMCSGHPRIPAARAGVAQGPVVVREGDPAGPVVSLAARAMSVAAPGEVVVTAALAEATGARAVPLGARSSRGFDAPIELALLLPDEATT